MIVLFFDIGLLLILMNLNFVLFNSIVNIYFDFCIYSYILFCIFILPVILMKKNKRALKCHFISLIIINFTTFFNYHLTLRSLFLSFYILEILFLYFLYCNAKKQLRQKQ